MQLLYIYVYACVVYILHNGIFLLIRVQFFDYIGSRHDSNFIGVLYSLFPSFVRTFFYHYFVNQIENVSEQLSVPITTVCPFNGHFFLLYSTSIEKHNHPTTAKMPVHLTSILLTGFSHKFV